MGRRSRKRIAAAERDTSQDSSACKSHTPDVPSSPAPAWDRLIEYKMEDQVNLKPEPYPRLDFRSFHGRARQIVVALLVLELGIFMSGIISFSLYLFGALSIPLLIFAAHKDTYGHPTLWGRVLISGGGILLAVLFFPNIDLPVTRSLWLQYALCASGTLTATLGIGELLLRHPRMQNPPWNIVAYPMSVAVFTLAGLMIVFGLSILIQALFI